MIFELTALSGHIDKAIATAIEIQTAFPHLIFYLTFNSVSIPVGNSPVGMKQYYERHLKS